jgi:DNA-binding HxlR family transcriptional regulator
MPRIRKALPHVPAERTLKVISGRWKVFILYFLRRKPHRLSELRRLASGASAKMLVQQLRELEAHGIVRRQIFAEVPARVEYSLTRLGATLGPLLDELCDWGRRHAEAVRE